MIKYLHKYIGCPHIAVRLLVEHRVGIPLPVWFTNALFQRVFRVNSEIPFSVNFTSRVLPGRGIHLGRNVWKSFALSGGCYIQGGNGVHIGDDTVFAPGVKIVSANHDPAAGMSWAASPPVKIGCRCWIGANAVILPGVEIGDDSIVAAGAVVTSSFPSGSIVGGVPARLIRSNNDLAV
jgi:acetyltransferase-like isoleucine patch superfamily enzyme